MGRNGRRSLAPISSTVHTVRNHPDLIYDVLVAQDAGMITRSQMADWTISEDGLTYVVTPRDGLKFHDGTPVTSQDVVASLKRRGQREGGGRLIFAVTEALEAGDDKTVTWRFCAAFPQLTDTRGKPFAAEGVSCRSSANPRPTPFRQSAAGRFRAGG